MPKNVGATVTGRMQRFPDQASSLTVHTGFEEFFRRSKATCVAPAASIRSCSESCIDSSSSNVRNHRGLFVPRHGPRLVQLHRSEQSNFRLAELDFRILDPDYRYSGRNVDRHRIFASPQTTDARWLQTHLHALSSTHRWLHPARQRRRIAAIPFSLTLRFLLFEICTYVSLPPNAVVFI